MPQELSLTPINLSQSPLPRDGYRKTPARPFWCLGLTFQVRLLSGEETDHSLQLAELPMVRINVSDAVNPGGEGRRSPQGQRKEKPQSSKWLLENNNCKQKFIEKAWAAKILLLLHAVPTQNLTIWL